MHLVDDVKEKIAELSSFMSHWDTSDVEEYAIGKNKELNEEEIDEEEPFVHSDYYRKIEQDNAAIKEMFGSLIG